MKTTSPITNCISLTILLWPLSDFWLWGVYLVAAPDAGEERKKLTPEEIEQKRKEAEELGAVCIKGRPGQTEQEHPGFGNRILD